MATTIKLRSAESQGSSRRSKALENPALNAAWACLQHSSFALGYVDSELHLIYCNGAFAQLCDSPLEKLLRKPLVEIIPFAGLVCKNAILRDAPGKEHVCHGLLARTNGDAAPLKLTLCPDTTGNSGFLVTLVPDPLNETSAVPDHHQAPSRRQPPVPEGRDQFLAVLEHELRNPLTPILAWTEVLKQEPNPTQQMRRAVSAIERSVLQQRALVDDLLDLASIHSGSLRCEQFPVCIYSVLAESVSHFEARAREKDIDMVFESLGAEATVTGDRRRLAQIFDNLLDNAVKFTPRGGRIEVRMKCELKRVRIDISDTGIGIAPDFMSELFKTFTQAHPLASRHRRGLGLGLALVKNLIERHNGEVQAASSGENLGSTFSIFLPLQVPDVMSTGTAVADFRRKVLIVEDRDDTREALRTLLESWGFHVAEAPDGIAGLKTVAEFAPDLVLCDLSMPVMDGWEMARQLRESIPAAQIPLIALSGHGTPCDIQRSLDSGFQAHIVKPCEARALLSVLKKFLPVSARCSGDGQQ